jgi:hypothetical protein
MSAEVVGVRGEDGRVEAEAEVRLADGQRDLLQAVVGAPADPRSLPRSYSLPGSSASGLPPLCAATGLLGVRVTSLCAATGQRLKSLRVVGVPGEGQPIGRSHATGHR